MLCAQSNSFQLEGLYFFPQTSLTSSPRVVLGCNLPSVNRLVQITLMKDVAAPSVHFHEHFRVYKCNRPIGKVNGILLLSPGQGLLMATETARTFSGHLDEAPEGCRHLHSLSMKLPAAAPIIQVLRSAMLCIAYGSGQNTLPACLGCGLVHIILRVVFCKHTVRKPLNAAEAYDTNSRARKLGGPGPKPCISVPELGTKERAKGFFLEITEKQKCFIWPIS